MASSARRSVGGIAIAVAMLCPTPAQAHSDPNLAGGFLAGFAHPFSGFDHLLAMVAVGLWGAFLGRPLIVVLPMVFPAMMAVGGALGMVGVPAPPIELGIAVSVIGLGAAIAARWTPPVPVAVAVIAVFALFHGYAHGHELPSIADPIAYSVGFVLATGSLHLVGIALGLVERWSVGTIVIRVTGALIAVTGLWFLYRAFG